MADGNAAEVNTLAKAASGSLSFFKADVLKPVAVGAAAGGGAVVLGRYFTRKMFVRKNADGTYVMNGTNYVNEDDNSDMKRGAVKILMGLAAGSALRKYSPPAALGVVLGLGVDGVADIIGTKMNSTLDRWFQPRTTSGVAMGGGAQVRSIR